MFLILVCTAGQYGRTALLRVDYFIQIQLRLKINGCFISLLICSCVMGLFAAASVYHTANLL